MSQRHLLAIKLPKPCALSKVSMGANVIQNRNMLLAGQVGSVADPEEHTAYRDDLGLSKLKSSDIRTHVYIYTCMYTRTYPYKTPRQA